MLFLKHQNKSNVTKTRPVGEPCEPCPNFHLDNMQNTYSLCFLSISLMLCTVCSPVVFTMIFKEGHLLKNEIPDTMGFVCVMDIEIINFFT